MARPTSRARSRSASRRTKCARAITAVLKGHIAIATARFPKGTRGIDLDPFARRALWDQGVDFDHGTGHGIGSYLVGARRPAIDFARRHGRAAARHADVERARLLQRRRLRHPHRERRAGHDHSPRFADGDREMMAFETLTLAPIRSQLDRCRRLDHRRIRLAECLSCARLRYACAAALTAKRRRGCGTQRRSRWHKRTTHAVPHGTAPTPAISDTFSCTSCYRGEFHGYRFLISAPRRTCRFRCARAAPHALALNLCCLALTDAHRSAAGNVACL